MVGGIVSIPAIVLLRDPSLGLLNVALVGVALASGVACLAVPWQRVPRAVFHLIPVTASIEVATTVAAVKAHGPIFEWFYVLVAVFTAFAFDSRRTIVAHLGFATAAACTPLLYAGGGATELVRLGVLVPMLWVAAAIVACLREGLVARQQELAELARRDPLTDVGNRRLLDERLDYEIVRHRRAGRELALLALDLDDFKQVNDELGHTAGDYLLAQVARILERTVREGDTVVRHGGDEFCVVAPETDLAEAGSLAERIRAALAEVELLDGPLTATIGVAVFPADGATAPLLLAAADAAERRAKERRRGAPAAGPGRGVPVG